MRARLTPDVLNAHAGTQAKQGSDDDNNKTNEKRYTIHGIKKPTMNELSRCSYPISNCLIWSEVGPK